MTIGALVSSVLVALFSVAGIQVVEENQQSVGVNLEQNQVEMFAKCGCNKRGRCNHVDSAKEDLEEQIARCCNKRKRCNQADVAKEDLEAQIARCCNKRKRCNQTDVAKEDLEAQIARCCNKRKRCNQADVVKEEQLAGCGCNKRDRSNHSQTVNATFGVSVAC